jgi:ribosomal protein L36
MQKATWVWEQKTKWDLSRRGRKQNVFRCSDSQWVKRNKKVCVLCKGKKHIERDNECDEWNVCVCARARVLAGCSLIYIVGEEWRFVRTFCVEIRTSKYFILLYFLFSLCMCVCVCVQLFPCLIKHDTMKAFGEVEV